MRHHVRFAVFVSTVPALLLASGANYAGDVFVTAICPVLAT